MSKTLSATMAICMAETIERGGKLVRHPGGYWAQPGAPRNHNGIPIDHFGTKTVQALVDRGELEYIKWRKGRNGRFPVAAGVVGKFGKEPDEGASSIPPDILMAG